MKPILLLAAVAIFTTGCDKIHKLDVPASKLDLPTQGANKAKQQCAEVGGQLQYGTDNGPPKCFKDGQEVVF